MPLQSLIIPILRSQESMISGSAYVDKSRAAAVVTDGFDLTAALKKKLMVKKEVIEKSEWVIFYNVSFQLNLRWS